MIKRKYKMIEIKYLVGDATLPIKKPAIIVHVTNNLGAWGAGFVIAVTQRFGKGPESSYRLWSQTPEFKLGEIQMVTVNKDITVVNMVAQTGLISRINQKPLNLPALKNCLKQVYSFAKGTSYTVHMPRIGCGLAGGKWEEVEPLIKSTMTVDTYVYDFEP